MNNVKFNKQTRNKHQYKSITGIRRLNTNNKNSSNYLSLYKCNYYFAFCLTVFSNEL